MAQPAGVVLVSGLSLRISPVCWDPSADPIHSSCCFGDRAGGEKSNDGEEGSCCIVELSALHTFSLQVRAEPPLLVHSVENSLLASEA